jgi:hypothetical protein
MDAARTRGHVGDSGHDRGHAVVLAIAAVVLAATLAVGLAHMAAGVVHREHAQAAADAAALAGASSGRTAASRVARANGAVLVAYTVVQGASGTIEVAVSYRGTVARARAARAP